jgi:Bacterial PH domain
MASDQPPLPDEVFPTRVDRWVIVLLVTVVALPVVIVAIPTGSANHLWLARAVTVAITALVGLLLASFFHGTGYTLRPTELFVRGGPLTWHIPYAEIHAAEWSRSVVSSPAMSLHRLRIRYGKYGWVLISPPDREAFVAALARRVPGLVVKR